MRLEGATKERRVGNRGEWKGRRREVKIRDKHYKGWKVVWCGAVDLPE